MNLEIHKTLYYFLITIVLTVFTAPVLAQVYKSVDADGNVTYTDRPPSAGAEPVELRPISVIEAPIYEPPATPGDDAAAGEGDKEMSLGYLRKNYADFSIISPMQEESVWHPETPVTAAWQTRYTLQEGMQVIIYLNGNELVKTTSPIVPLGKLNRGEHTLQAQLKDAKNRRIATATPVTFFIRRPNIYTSRPGPSPRGR